MQELSRKHNHRRSTRASRPAPSVLDRIQVDVAGIDCGAAEHYVSVPPDRDPTPVRSFRTFTADLERLADWLVACRITSVAMEATGVYWIPVYGILEARGLEVLLVNARHVKHVPGRKSDVEDCEWLRFLLIKNPDEPRDRTNVTTCVQTSSLSRECRHTSTSGPCCTT